MNIKFDKEPSNPLFSIKLASNPDLNAIKNIKELGVNNPKQQDVLLKNWASEIRQATKSSTSEDTESKLEVQKLLEEAKELSEDLLTQIISQETGSTFSVYKNTESGTTVYVERGSLGGITLHLEFKSPKCTGAVKWAWAMENDMLINNHREIENTDLRNYKIGDFMERTTEHAAKNAGLRKVFWRTSGNNDAGITFPLTQGYTCVNTEDRNEAIEILLSVHKNLNKNEKRHEYEVGKGYVLLEKEIL